MGMQGVQEETEDAHLWGPSVENQCGGVNVAYLHHLGGSVRKSRTQLHREEFSPGAVSFVVLRGH